IDLRSLGVVRDAADAIEARTLVRANAVPYAFDGDRLLIAIADPADVQSVDELRIATRREIVLGVAPREDIELELRNLERQVEATRRHVVDEAERFSYEEEAESSTEDEASGP